MTFVMEFLPHNGTELAYHLTGNGDQTLVFIHAGVADSRSWQGQIEAFAGDYRVLVYDLRGYGQSVMPPDVAYAHHEDLHALLTHLGIERATLVGVSMGGKTAINFALTYPALVDRLVLVCSALAGYELGTDAVLQRVYEGAEGIYEQGDIAALITMDLQAWYAGQRPLEVLSAEVQTLAREMLARAYELEFAAGDVEERDPTPPPMERLGEIAGPTLVLIGEYDVPVMHTIAALLAEQIPAAQHQVLADTAHMPYVERPAEFNAVVRTFLTA